MKLIQNKNLNCYEKFFCERILELVHKTTIDSYRIRTMNIKLILPELLHLSEGWVNGRVHNFSTVLSCQKETVALLKEDEVFISKTISKSYFIEFLEESINEKDEKGLNLRNNLVKLKSIIHTVLRENDKYGILLLDKICYYIDNPISPKDEFLTFIEIDKLTSFLMTNLIGLGYHKSYLSIIFNIILSDKKIFFFSDIKNEIYRMITAREKKYRVWFKFFSSEEICNSLQSFSTFTVCDLINEVPPIKTEVIKEFKKFNIKLPYLKYILVEIDALDYFAALYKAKPIIAESLDILNLGYGNINSNITDRAYVVDAFFPERAEFREVRYALDGRYKYGQLLFDDIYKKIPSLLEKNYIHIDTKEKIKSAFHYLRLGNEALEIEHKIINYWFGLEYLFAHATDNSFKRIITYLPQLQAISYIKRNVIDIYEKALLIEKVNPLSYISRHSHDCFNQQNFYKEIKENLFSLSPLISYRAWFLEHRIFGNGSDGKRESYINAHITKLEQQIRRIYHVRNEIVHEAQYNTSNENLASNLKYYLIFSLSNILGYLLSHDIQENTTIDDFLQLQEVKFEYLKKCNFPIEDILNITNSHELLGG